MAMSSEEDCVKEQVVIVDRVGRVGVITLNRPKVLNALNDELMNALGAALLAFDADDEIGSIVIAGSPRAFAAGADVSAMANWSYSDVYKSNFITRNWETIRQVRKPVIASVAAWRWAVAANWHLHAISSSPLETPYLRYLRSSSACCQVRVARSAFPERSGRQKQWTCACPLGSSTPKKQISMASCLASWRTIN
jgi:hypothetical protein